MSELVEEFFYSGIAEEEQDKQLWVHKNIFHNTILKSAMDRD